MYRRLAFFVTTHPWRIVVGWAFVVVVALSIALWGFGEPLSERLHSDLPESQTSESYRGNDIIATTRASEYPVVAGINGLDLGPDIRRAREARREITEAKAEAQAQTELAKQREAEARSAQAEALNPATPPAQRLAAAQRAQELGAQAADAGAKAQAAGERARAAAAVSLPRVDALANALDDKLDAIARMKGVTSVAAPFSPRQALLSEAADNLVNSSGTKAAVVVTLDVDDGNGKVSKAGQAEIDAVNRALLDVKPQIERVAPGADVQTTSMRLIEQTALRQLRSDLVLSEGVGIPLSVAIMIFVFGGVLAALMPAAGAIVAISSALAVMLGMTYVAEQQSFALNIISVLGLGLSIDYGLLVLSRYREELDRCRGGEVEAEHRLDVIKPHLRQFLKPLEITLASAGRTVMFSATTVAVSILGMLVFPPNLLRSLGIAGVTVVLLAMACAVTLVPALAFVASPQLVKTPHTPLGRAFAKLRARRVDPSHSWWSSLGRTVNHHPWPFLVVSVACLVICIIPVGHLQLRNSMFELLAHDDPQKIMLAEFSDVPAIDIPAITVVAHTDDTAVLDQWRDQIRHWDDVASVSAPSRLGDGYTHMSISVEGGDRGSPQAVALVDKLRDHRPAGVTTYITGQAAQQSDFVAALGRGFPYALGIIVVACLVLLFGLTRSIVVPIKALIINSASLSAALGISTWVIQDGHGVWLLGAERLGGIESYVVVMMLCIGFGLSMDYEVFLLARMRESYVRTGDNDRAVVTGLAHSGRIITSAAGILVCVLLAFCLSHMIVLKQVGFVMAVTVALDATLVRLFLVPSLMTLFGDFNWWAPRWMRRGKAHETILLDQGDEAA